MHILWLYRGDAVQLASRAYERGRAFALKRGIEIIDGKFEGSVDTLGDELLTPDSCRFVRADGIVVGQESEWLDKQYVREAAEKEWAGGKKIPLQFSPEVYQETTNRYATIYQALTGQDFWEKLR